MTVASAWQASSENDPVGVHRDERPHAWDWAEGGGSEQEYIVLAKV